jgi:hypothetical protein
MRDDILGKAGKMHTMATLHSDADSLMPFVLYKLEFD